MLYHSTRNKSITVTGAQAIINGLAPDGGLYVPCTLPALDVKACLEKDTFGMADMILRSFFNELANMDSLVEKAYRGKFETEDLTPTVGVGDMTVLELFRGPTCAFKDVALRMLPQLLTASRAHVGMTEPVLILTATSGDTGKAALEGFRDVEGIDICVFYPHGGVSNIQRAQMATQEGNNVDVCAVVGNFDDAQTGVKKIFEKGSRLGKVSLSSANSINIGRLVPQITYYFKAYADLMHRGTVKFGDKVNFCVPTGNFGDILAGYLAKELGLPVGKLICASNANNVLTDFIRTGTYDRNRPLYKTTSPSMDILVSSNLERLLYLLTEDDAFVAKLMKSLNETGVYTVPDGLQEKLRTLFWAGCCDDALAGKTIGKVYKEYGYLCDPHTANGWAVAEQYRAETGDTAPTVVLSTASPYKFPSAVLEALGAQAAENEFDRLAQLEELTGVPVPAPLAGLEGKKDRFTTVIEKEKMYEYVKKSAK